MGRWSYSNRGTTEECKFVSVSFLNKHHYFDGGIRSGGMNWSRGGEQIGNMDFEVSTLLGDEYIRFKYTLTNNQTEVKTVYDYKAQIVSTPCYFGGRRWWFICPLVKDGRVCNRRVGVLYLAGGNYFGCRHCYNLTYKSSRESHGFDRLFRDLGQSMGMPGSMVKNLFSERLFK